MYIYLIVLLVQRLVFTFNLCITVCDIFYCVHHAGGLLHFVLLQSGFTLSCFLAIALCRARYKSLCQRHRQFI